MDEFSKVRLSNSVSSVTGTAEPDDMAVLPSIP